MFTITAMCSRVIYISDGRVGFDGEPEEVIRLYEQDTHVRTPVRSTGSHNGSSALHPVHITEVALLDESGQPRKVYDHGERMRVRLSFEAVHPVKTPNFVVAFIRSDNVACCNYASAMDGVHIPSVAGTGVVELLTPPLKLVAELYTLHVLVWDPEFQRLYFSQRTGASFQVRHSLFNAAHFGVFHESGEWTWQMNEIRASFPMSPPENGQEDSLHISTRG
jgi:lipopolysaccharide transport system ATP-binding protein